ncbi:hypothetical protein SDC9_197858 [bioreactor metagenome]|uniref:DUF7305 domain-containing protein n=1 Tax=bioreactor metagenome TaxID=1076179 RepID=A0A645IHB4_9ZZZZ
MTIYGGGPFRIYGNLYVSGSIYFGNTVYVEGSIMAGGTINFTGWDNRFNANSAVCIYSATGDIHLTTASTTATGIVYAPNGTVYLAGNTLTFYGSIVGYQVSGIPGNLTMGEPSEPIDFLPGSGTTTIKLVE